MKLFWSLVSTAVLFASKSFQISLKQSDVADLQFWAKYSGIAYCLPKEIQEFKCNICDVGNTTVQVHKVLDPGGDSQAYIATDSAKKSIIVSFRGTLTPKSAIANLDLSPGTTREGNFLSAYPEAYVHAGYLKIYLDHQDEVRKLVSQLIQQHPDYQIMFTGHSQGGGLANLAALDARTTYAKATQISLITYGEPRVGNRAFVEALNKANLRQSFRATYSKDPIPLTPLRNEHLNVFSYLHLTPYSYVHRKNEVHLEEGQEVLTECDDEQNEDPKCALKEYNMTQGIGRAILPEMLKNLPRYHLNYFGVPQAGLGLGCMAK